MHAPDHTHPHAQPERVVLRVRTHGRTLLFPVLTLIAAAAACGYWGGSLPEPWMNAAVWAGFALCVVFCASSWLRWLMRRTVITQRRLIMKRGVFVQHRSDLPFARVREVRSRRSLLQQLFGCGNVVLITGDAEPTVLRNVAGSDLVCDALRELIDRHLEHSAQQQIMMAQLGPQGGATAGWGATVQVPVPGSTDAPVDVQSRAHVSGFDVVAPERAGYTGGRFTRVRRSGAE